MPMASVQIAPLLLYILSGLLLGWLIWSLVRNQEGEISNVLLGPRDDLRLLLLLLVVFAMGIFLTYMLEILFLGNKLTGK